MRVFVVGATGYIGGSVVERLQAHGHTVVGLARSEAAAATLQARGVHVWSGELRDTVRLVEAAHETDGVIYVAQSQEADMLEIERTATLELLKGLAGSHKPFIFTSGCGLIGNTGTEVADEESIPHPPAFFRPRLETEKLVLAAAPTVRTIIVRPALVYGQGGGAFAALIAATQRIGCTPYVDEGKNRWPTVHVVDLADLYVRAITQAQAGSLFHGVNATALEVREIAVAISHAAGTAGQTVSWTYERIQSMLGLLAGHFLLDQQVKSELAQRLLGWYPDQNTVIEELTRGSYVKHMQRQA